MEIKKLACAKGEITVPGDKSISHRGVMLGALAKGVTRISGFLSGADCLSTIDCFRKMGINIETEGDNVTVYGKGVHGLSAPKEMLYTGNSGTTTRLLCGILSGQEFDSSITGDASICKRPMKRVAEPLRLMGAKIDGDFCPLHISGTKLHGMDYQMQVASAQVKTAVLLAGLYAEGETIVRETEKSRDHTELMLKAMGAKLDVDGTNITLNPGAELYAQNIEVPGDISSAAFFMVAAALTPNSKVKLVNVSLNPTRTGILRVLEKMNANMTIQARQSDGEPLGDIIVESSKLTAIKIGPKDVPALIDELPLVALLAAHADGISEIKGAAELRFKETDRIKTVCQELGKLGVNVKELQDGMVIEGQPQLRVTADISWDSHGDHRLGMLGAVAALRNPGQFRLKNSQALGISYPSFLTDLASLIVG